MRRVCGVLFSLGLLTSAGGEFSVTVIHMKMGSVVSISNEHTKEIILQASGNTFFSLFRVRCVNIQHDKNCTKFTIYK